MKKKVFSERKSWSISVKKHKTLKLKEILLKKAKYNFWFLIQAQFNLGTITFLNNIDNNFGQNVGQIWLLKNRLSVGFSVF